MPSAKQPQKSNPTVAVNQMAQRAIMQIELIADRADCEVGVAAWRLGAEHAALLLNSNVPFPMASTFKIAVACRILEQFDAGQLALTDLIPIPEDMRVPSSIISERFIHPGIALSIHNLLQVMLDDSDNSATDVLMELAGGPEAVSAALRRWGIEGQTIHRDTRGLLRDFYELEDGPFMEAMRKGCERPDHEARVTSPNPAFENDPRDRSTPRAMNMLLDKILAGGLLSGGSVQIMRAIMAQCRTGDARLRAMVPEGTWVADKTGTVGGIVNDVGSIMLPADLGEIVISVFIKGGTAEPAIRERTIAEIARIVYDFYLFHGSSESGL